MTKPKKKIKHTRDIGVPLDSSIPDPPLVFYHWSPQKNRKSIEKVGLRPGQLSIEGLWRPPYVCFGDNPVLAWNLSGALYPNIEHWDLWACFEDIQTSFDGYEVITDTLPRSGEVIVKEYRVYKRVYKRDLYYVGSRRVDG